MASLRLFAIMAFSWGIAGFCVWYWLRCYQRGFYRDRFGYTYRSEQPVAFSLKMAFMAILTIGMVWCAAGFTADIPRALSPACRAAWSPTEC